MHQTLEDLLKLTELLYVAYPEKEIHNIKHTGVFGVDKTGFLRLGHICKWC